MSRRDCVTLIAEAGLPVPPKSSCWFCPYQRREQWQRLHNDNPALFDAAVALEQRINEKRASLERDNVYSHASLIPLDRAVGDQSDMFSAFEDAACESGYCMT
jgi:hypothetical protein